VARLGALASLRAASWATSSTVAVTRRVVHAARQRESPAELFGEARDEALDAARRALGVTDLEETLGRITSERPRRSEATSGRPKASAAPSKAAEARPKRLRDRGEELLARSARVAPEDEEHPAFGMLLEELTPDEARILRVLATLGPQPLIDIEAGGPLGDGRTVARRLSVVHELAGCHHQERLPLYLDNLLRLGLVEASEDELTEEAYEVLEANPDVNDAKEEASKGMGRAKVLRRRLILSEFGRSFCETCLPLEQAPQQAARPSASGSASAAPARAAGQRPARPRLA
jgi:hypothetical protein